MIDYSRERVIPSSVYFVLVRGYAYVNLGGCYEDGNGV
jgi:hypothetical protein